ncbi:hypothetical protein D6C84_00968 [Aureobasidium pullulans]|uniref:F-box domain-containing protein n=1 Tax=Aureobasidium pullulans TaxID=5580 RepID=A0A4S9YBF2_AURPU|nr:hypothetical protein D6C84_00968 [Aureobasidium pullulans]
MDEEVNRDKAPRAEHPDSSSPPSLVLDGNITDVVESTGSVSANNDLAMTDAEDAQIAQHMSTISPAALDVAGNNLDKKSEQAPFEKLPNELRHIIIGYIGINKSLYNAVRVNKAWFDSLIDHLWYKPRWGALVRPVEGRRQFYADKIRIFELDGNVPAGFQNRKPVHWSQLKPVHWSQVFPAVRLPNLQKLVYDGPSNLPDEIMCHLLQPTLVSVEFRSSFDVSPSVLEALQNCPRLRHLVFQDRVVVFDLDPFIDFITNHSCMTSIKFGGGIYTTDPLVDHSNKIYAHLLRLSRFSSLSLGKEIDQTDAEEIMNMVGRPLVPNNSLTSLSIHGHTLAVNLFLSTATRALRSLNITLLEEYSGNVCDQLSQFTNLAELRLRMCSSRHCHKAKHRVAQALPYLELLFELAPRLERLELQKKDDDYCKTTCAIQTAIKEICGNACDEDGLYYWKFSKEMVEKYKDENDKDEEHS